MIDGGPLPPVAPATPVAGRPAETPVLTNASLLETPQDFPPPEPGQPPLRIPAQIASFDPVMLFLKVMSEVGVFTFKTSGPPPPEMATGATVTVALKPATPSQNLHDPPGWTATLILPALPQPARAQIRAPLTPPTARRMDHTPPTPLLGADAPAAEMHSFTATQAPPLAPPPLKPGDVVSLIPLAPPPIADKDMPAPDAKTATPTPMPTKAEVRPETSARPIASAPSPAIDAETPPLPDADPAAFLSARLHALITALRRDADPSRHALAARVIDIIFAEKKPQPPPNAKPDLQAPPSTPPAPETKNSFSLRIESRDLPGLLILRDDKSQDRFALRARLDAPDAARILFSKDLPQTLPTRDASIDAPAPQGRTDPASPPPLAWRTTGWPALETMLNILDRLETPEKMQALRSAIPTTSAPQNFPAATLLFMAALKAEKIEHWLGDSTLQALRRENIPAIAETLAKDFETLTQNMRQHTPGGWTATPIPILHDGQIMHAEIFVRRSGDEDGAETQGHEQKNGLTRFLLNLNLSRMGEMQIDGLLRKGRLDAVIRTDAPLSPGAKAETARRFEMGLAQTGIEGAITFQARRNGWVNARDIPAPPVQDIIA